MPSPALTRRQLLKRSLAVSAGMVVGTGFLASSSGAWAMEVKTLAPATMATLVQMARDIYPHDRFGDALYAAALKGHDDSAAKDPEYKKMIEDGVAGLDQAAMAAGHSSYLATGWEADRVELLKSMESDSFFQTIRGGLVVGLYNQPAVWDKLGYEGSSFEKGGYINRGFSDINWL
ncbi:Twin-arginine translocation pathway signal [Chromatiales bacterium (ex Bugula neritina AB1)]|nr:Twin-arginine translocation pathway signal [Chromatiales bacterium (ex Bugula neritina AB1)]